MVKPVSVGFCINSARSIPRPHHDIEPFVHSEGAIMKPVSTKCIRFRGKRPSSSVGSRARNWFPWPLLITATSVASLPLWTPKSCFSWPVVLTRFLPPEWTELSPLPCSTPPCRITSWSSLPQNYIPYLPSFRIVLPSSQAHASTPALPSLFV